MVVACSSKGVVAFALCQRKRHRCNFNCVACHKRYFAGWVPCGIGRTLMQQLLKDAIANKRVVEFSYGGHRRLVEPHILGISGGPRRYWDIRLVAQAVQVVCPSGGDLI